MSGKFFGFFCKYFYELFPIYEQPASPPTLYGALNYVVAVCKVDFHKNTHKHMHDSLLPAFNLITHMLGKFRRFTACHG